MFHQNYAGHRRPTTRKNIPAPDGHTPVVHRPVILKSTSAIYPCPECGEPNCLTRNEAKLGEVCSDCKREKSENIW